MESLQRTNQVQQAIQLLTSRSLSKVSEKIEKNAIAAIVTLQQNINAVPAEKCCELAKTIRNISKKFENQEKA